MFSSRAAVLALLLSGCISYGCASASAPPRMPYPACLKSNSRMNVFDTGRVIAERGDGWLLFEYDDQFSGDRGFQWVEAGRVRRCASTTWSGAAENP